MYVLLETVTVIVTQTLPKSPTAILTTTWTVTFMSSNCMYERFSGRRTAAWSRLWFSLSFEMIVFHHPSRQVLERWKNPKQTSSFLTSLHTHTHTHTHWSAARRPVSWWTVLYWYEVLIWNLRVNHQCSANDKRVHRHTKSFPNHCKESISFYCPARKQKHNRVYDLKTLFKCVTMSEGICDSYWAHKWVIYSVINGWADGNITQWSILTLSSNNLWDGECLFYFRTAERKSREKLILIHIHLGSMQRKPVYKVTYWMLCLYS